MFPSSLYGKGRRCFASPSNLTAALMRARVSRSAADSKGLGKRKVLGAESRPAVLAYSNRRALPALLIASIAVHCLSSFLALDISYQSRQINL